ncbi:MAG: ParB N-terminal domain-containing protein, partial [Actinomycetes bacterium]
MSRKGGLGRGLGAILPPAAVEDAQGLGLRVIPIAQIVPNPHQPRKVFDEATLDGLVESVKELGVL